jgi:hypothetical protein
MILEIKECIWIAEIIKVNKSVDEIYLNYNSSLVQRSSSRSIDCRGDYGELYAK